MGFRQVSVQFVESEGVAEALPHLQRGGVDCVMGVNIGAHEYGLLRDGLPDAEIILRWVSRPHEFGGIDGAGGHRYADWLWDKYREYGLDADRTIIHSLNEETSPENREKLRALGRFDNEFARHWHERGFRVGTHAFATGTPQAWVGGALSIDYYLEYGREAWEGGEGPDYWFVHEYARHGRPDWGRPWEQGRMMTIWPLLPEYMQVPVRVTECGFEDGGWRYRDSGGRTREIVSPADYIAIQRDYARDWMRDDWRALLFAVSPGNKDWWAYDVLPFIEQLGDAWAAEIDAPEPPPVPEPPPETEEPMPQQLNIVDRLPTHATKRYSQRTLDDIRRVVVHHTVSNPSGDEVAHIQAIARHHVTSDQLDAGGAPGIAYTRVVGLGGTVYLTQPLEAISWHAGNTQANADGIGVALLGNRETEPPPQAQIDGLIYALRRLQAVTPHDLAIIGHYEVRDTACPGRFVIEQLDDIRRAVGDQPEPPPEGGDPREIAERLEAQTAGIGAQVAGLAETIDELKQSL